MITSIKDEATLIMTIYNLRNSGKLFICTLCGETMDIHPIECPKCNFKNK